MIFARAALLLTLLVGLAQALPTIYTRGSGLKTSANPKDWPSNAQLKKALATKPNGAFFWTGRNGDESVEELAASIAASAGGATLESSLAKAGLIMPVFTQRNQAAVDVWVSASKIFAQGATGEAFCVQGATLRPGNVFESDELPILKKNKGITKVTRIDSKTKAKSNLFTAGAKSKLRRGDEVDESDDAETVYAREDDEETLYEREDEIEFDDDEDEDDTEDDIVARSPKSSKVKTVKPAKVTKPKTVKAAKPAKVAKPAKAATPAKATKAVKTKAAKATAKGAAAAKATKTKAASKSAASAASTALPEAGCESSFVRCA